MRELRANCLAQYVETVSAIRKEWSEPEWIQPWFRGQANSSYGLVPGALRESNPISLVGDDGEADLSSEFEFRDEFARRAVQLAPQSVPPDHWGWYFLMQHYRAPTRLLDWTDSALVALYFAVTPPPGASTRPAADAAVWVLDPFWLNRATDNGDSILLPGWENADAFLPDLYTWDTPLPELPAAIDPPHISPRFSVQHSHFTIHGQPPGDIAAWAARKKEPRLHQIVISQAGIREIRKDLQVCGIVETSIYPDLEGLSRELANVYATEWIEEEE